MKNTRLFILVAMIIVFSGLTAAFAQTQSDTINNGRIMVDAKWGADEGEIGLINNPEMERCGPLSFCIANSKGDVLILDSVNQRVLNGVEGRLSTVATDVIGWTICPDGGGGFFIFNGRETVHYDGSGVKKEGFPLFSKAKITEGYGTELQLIADKNVEIADVSQKCFAIAKGDAESGARFISQSNEVKTREGRLGNLPDSLRFKIKRLSNNDIRILGEDYDRKILVSVPVKIDSGYAGAVLFKGQDLKGNLYVELERIVDNRAELEIHCYSPMGERLKIFKLPNKYFTTVYKKTEVTPDGTIYQLLTTPESVQIICY